jgi:hypothetical protein
MQNICISTYVCGALTYLCPRCFCVRLVAELKERDSHSEQQPAYQNVEDPRHVAK